MFLKRFTPILSISLLLLVALACHSSGLDGEEAAAIDQNSTATSLSHQGQVDEDHSAATPNTDSEVGELNPFGEIHEIDELGEDDSLVLIDRTNPAYVMYLHLPQEELFEILALLDEPESAQTVADLVGWQPFVAQYEQYTIVHTIRQDYPEVRVAEGLVALLEHYLGLPFGLTWNGGIALTSNDYAFTVASYEA